MMEKKKRILTGDRPTGKLHLGHYVGSLQSRVQLQHEYDTFILIADIQALTTHFENPALIYESIYNVTMDNLSVGLDPEIMTFVQQSQVLSLIHILVMMRLTRFMAASSSMMAIAILVSGPRVIISRSSY